MQVALSGYEWLLRRVVGLLDLFPPRRLEKEEILLRKGGYEPLEPSVRGTIWVHGSSLGEAITLRPFLAGLADVVGKHRIMASATTMDGYRRLRTDGLCGHVTLLPLELPEYLGPFVDRMQPRLLLISETEIWPLLLAALARRGIPYGIINGRINERSVRFLRLFRPLFEEALRHIAFVYPQNALYAGRFRLIGVPAHRITPMGCFKYDIEPGPCDVAALRRKFGIPPGRQVWCFGSTHPGEEEIILDALDPLWKGINVTVAFAPRKIDRVPDIERMLRQRRIEHARLSDGRRPSPRLLLVDSLGLLRDLYAVSSLAFVGGSLVKHGGHNLMEPAAYAVPIITGPHTHNFPSERKALVAADALTEVADAGALRQVMADAFADPGRAAEAGRRARAVLDRLAGASRRTLDALMRGGFLTTTHGR